MKQHKAMIVALIVICITAVVAALVTRKDLCEVHIRTGCKMASESIAVWHSNRS
ncbi:Hok/Gef family protein [Escherichia coli]|nr:Hok/Gef family protein [Escherichia coli]